MCQCQLQSNVDIGLNLTLQDSSDSLIETPEMEEIKESSTDVYSLKNKLQNPGLE